MAKCYTCGTIYNGWSCPTCSIKEKLEQTTKEQTEALEDSLREQERMLEEQRESMEYALREAEAEHKKTTSEAWQLQAEAKAKRAYELYKAGLNDEAIKLCFEAISQDPGNIKPYRIAVWSFEILGQDIKSKELLKKQINLLKTSDYQNSQGDALKVLQDILEMKNNYDLMQSFLDASKEFGNNIKLLGVVCGIELYKKNTGDLDGYLGKLPYTERNNLFEILKKIKTIGFSSSTIKLLKEKILEQYKEWNPEIKREIAETASKKAKEEARKKSSPTVIGW